MKNIILLGLCAFIGIGLVVTAIRMSMNETAFLAQAKVTQGTVTALVPSGSHNDSFAPGVTFVTPTGETIKFVSPSSSNPPSFHIGEKVDVLYVPSSPQQAQIKSFFSMWGGELIMGGLGTVFALVGVGMLLRTARNAKKVAWLKQYGVPVEAAIIETNLNTSYAVNGKNPFKITAQWQDPSTTKIHVFESENIWFDPAPYLSRQAVTVLIDSNNPKRYFMDLSFLPQLA